MNLTCYHRFGHGCKNEYERKHCISLTRRYNRTSQAMEPLDLNQSELQILGYNLRPKCRRKNYRSGEVEKSDQEQTEDARMNK